MTTKPPKQSWNGIGEAELTLEQLLERQAQHQFGPDFQRPQTDQLVGIDNVTAFELEVINRLDRILHWIERQEASDARLDAVIAAADDDCKTWHMPKGGYTIREFAVAARLPENRVRKAVKRKEIETIELGGVMRISPRELLRVLDLFSLPEEGKGKS